ncbi:MAG: DUF3419 family protein [Bacteroidales bacterium]|nr:DUF3419 family protein [Bacteroidales bacterium]
MSSNPKNSIRYSQCWEDSDIVLNALEIQPFDVVLSIASGGENVFSLMTKTENTVHAIDYNRLQIFIAELKFTALKNLEFDEYLKFVGVRKNKNRVKIFNKLVPKLEENCRNYFKKNTKLINKGIIHIGKFEKYLRIFSKTILPLFVSKSKIKKAISTENQEFRHNTFQKIWNNWRWRLFGEFFFGKSVMQKMGRHKVMFQYNDKQKTGSIYLDRAENFLKNGAIHENHYLDYILTGNFHKNLHYYLKEEKFNDLKIKNNLELSNSDILSFLKSKKDNSINKFNLSDIFESMNIKETNIIFNEILRTSTNNARIIFWNNLVERDIPNNIEENFIRDFELEQKLSPTEKVFFYNKFYIYKVNKTKI